MTTYRPRGVSPPPRRHGDPRSPVAPVFTTAFDTRFGQQSRNSLDTLTSSRPGGERLFDAQPISRRQYAASGHSAAQSKTEYAVRPRNNSLVKDDGRTPLRAIAAPVSTGRSRPLVNNAPLERSRSPLNKRYYASDEPERYILPAVSSPRHYGRPDNGMPVDPSRLSTAGRDRRERTGYRVAGSRLYPTGGAVVRYDDEADYSYTTPHEQFDRDYPPPEPRPRRNSYVRKDRPTSTSEFDDWKAISQPRRDLGPPPTVRQFDKVGGGDSRVPSNRSGNYSDTEREFDKPRRRHSLRAPVSLHQDREDILPAHRDERSTAREASRYHLNSYEEEPSYSSDRENYRPTSHYERHQQRPRIREEDHDRSGLDSHGTAAAGLGGLAAARLTGALVRKHHDKDDNLSRNEPHDVKERYLREIDQRPEETNRDRERILEKPRDRAAELRDEVVPREHRREKGRKERSDSDSIDDNHIVGHRHRRKHRHHRRDSRPQEIDSDSTSEDRKGTDTPKEVDRDHLQKDSAQKESDLPHRDRGLSNAHQRLPSEDGRLGGTILDGENDDGQEERAAHLQLVEPSKEKEPEPKPKGILKPARQVPFPEDPNPTREGVAPLKDAGKKGIPPGARWTKINRKLVNPAALEAAHERYEERDDYVIVLRVLSREEIQAFADSTTEIREARELEWLEQQERRRRKGGRGGGSGDSSDEERRIPLSIEPPPLASSTEAR